MAARNCCHHVSCSLVRSTFTHIWIQPHKHTILLNYPLVLRSNYIWLKFVFVATAFVANWLGLKHIFYPASYFLKKHWFWWLLLVWLKLLKFSPHPPHTHTHNHPPRTHTHPRWLLPITLLFNARCTGPLPIQQHDPASHKVSPWQQRLLLLAKQKKTERERSRRSISGVQQCWSTNTLFFLGAHLHRITDQTCLSDMLFCPRLAFKIHWFTRQMLSFLIKKERMVIFLSSVASSFVITNPVTPWL